MRMYEGSHQTNGIATDEFPDRHSQTMTRAAISQVTAPK
jgi:hypothetical protein